VARHRRHRTGLRLLGTALAVAVTGVAHARIDTSPRTLRGDLFVPRPDHVRISALGFDAVVGDYYWLQAVQLVGDDRHQAGTHGETIADLIEVVTTLDPWVDHAYRFAAVWLTEDLRAVRRANEILRRGIAYHPREWRNRFHLGFNTFFYLQDEARAAKILGEAVDLPGAPDYLGALAARLHVKGAGLSAAQAFLRELHRTAPDEYARAEYAKALDEIATERAARFLDAAREEFRRRHGRDIREPRELWQGPLAVVAKRPPPHPTFPGFAWRLDAETGRIESSFYEGRYELHVHPADEARRKRFREELEREAEAS